MDKEQAINLAKRYKEMVAVKSSKVHKSLWCVQVRKLKRRL